MQVLLSDTEGQECLPCEMCHNSTPYSLLNNGHPIVDGDVCSSCWAHHVVPARLRLTAQWARRQRDRQGQGAQTQMPHDGDQCTVSEVSVVPQGTDPLHGLSAQDPLRWLDGRAFQDCSRNGWVNRQRHAVGGELLIAIAGAISGHAVLSGAVCLVRPPFK